MQIPLNTIQGHKLIKSHLVWLRRWYLSRHNNNIQININIPKKVRKKINYSIEKVILWKN